ncbi:MAG: hypothetical protein IJ329_01200 [Clostridia bacterium]|nr:hypothetical protein [Clostridia bacterium]
MKKTLGILLATVCLGAAFAGCGEGTLDYAGDSLDGYVSEAAVSSNGGFAVEKGDYVYFINGQEEPDAGNEYGDVVKGALMRISKTDLANKNFSNVKTVVPSLLSAKDYDAGIFIYGDYVYYATPTTDKTDRGESVESSHIDFKKAKLDGSEGPMKDYFLRLSDNASVYRFVQENGTVYCLYEEDGALKSVNTETKEISTLVSGAKSAFFFDSKNPENPNVYYTMSVTAEDGSSQKYDQVYRVNAGATAKVDEDNAKYTVYDAKGNKIKEYAFDKAEMEDANDEAEDADEDELPYDFEDYTTYPYVNLGELVLDGVGSANYIPQTQYNWESKENRVNCDEYDGYTYTLGQDCYQDGTLYLTRTAVGTKTDSDGTDTKLFYLSDSAVDADGWSVISGNKTVSENIVALNTTYATTGSALFYQEGLKQYYIYLANSNLYKAGYDNEIDPTTGKAKGAIEEVRIAQGVGTPTLWTLDETNKYVYFYADSGNGYGLSRVNYGGSADNYNTMHAEKEYQVVTLEFLVFNSDWYKPEFIGDTLLYSNAVTFGESTYDYIYATKMGTVDEIETANETYNKVQDKIEEYSAYSDLTTAMDYYYRTGETTIFEEFRDQYSKSKGEYFDAFVELFAEGNEFHGMLERDLTAQVGKTSEDDEESMAEGWRNVLRKVTETEEEEDEGLPTWAIWLISCGSGAFALAVIIFVVRRIKKRKARKAEEEATVNAYKRKKIDTTDDKSIDVYADDEDAEESEEVVEVVEETATEEAVETAEETVAEEINEKDE